MRSVLIAAAAVMVMSTSMARADTKADCQKGVASLKAELKRKHPDAVLATLRKELSDAGDEVMEQDWSECMDHVKAARAALKK